MAMLSQKHTDLSSMDKSEVSKSLFGLIQWEDILRSGVILAHRDHQLLEKAHSNLGVILDSPQDSKDLANMLLKIADNCTSNLTVQQYVFTRIEEILGLGIDYGDSDIEIVGSKHASLFTMDGVRLIDAPFLRALNSPDIYLQKSASSALACLYTECEGSVATLVEWINSKLSATSAGIWEMASPALTMLSRSPGAREIFVNSGGVGYAVGLLNKMGANGSAQHIYELSFILWTLSLGVQNKDLPSFLKAGAIRVVYDLVCAAPSRKVVRMSIATLRNLACTENDDVLTEMLTAGVDRQLETMIQSNSHKQTGDVELESDVKFLHDILVKNYKDLSTFDKWSSEVHSGALRWGIVHTEKFWRENAKLVEQNEFKLIKEIIMLLASPDATIVSIALYDLGEFTRFYPNGRVIASRLKGKEIALQMIGHQNPDIQSQALSCISKIMVSNWEHMK
eukprot:CAMPEP_0119035284 /NCGR_PEP_ID=MMETSP1177-20130426/2213_1 /TAXON_ID=2985 /ORGANISM="Ochromonas sp, Strain CCMP1899" /LENGTH=451 /DNA_ID=CAMNT_0006993307 /DNA_START=122 /DNA_END=1477 /DNA_ORIENTATION=+